jgi:hypothetical protein
MRHRQNLGTKKTKNFIKHLFSFKRVFNFALFFKNDQERNYHTIRTQAL